MVEQARIEEIETACRMGVMNKVAINLAMTGEKKNVGQLIGDFLDWRRTVRNSRNTIATCEFTLRAFARKTNTTESMPQELNEEHVNQYVNDDGKSRASTRKIRLSHLSSFFKWLAAKGFVNGNPAALVPVDLSALTLSQKEPKAKLAFADNEVVKILDKQLDPFWRYAVLVGRYAGLRLGDIAQMEWRSWNMDFEAIGRVPPATGLTVWTEKRDKRINLELASMGTVGSARLRRAHEVAWSEIPFATDDRPFTEKLIWPRQAAIARNPRKRSLLSHQFAGICRDAGIEGKTFHSLRRSFVTDARRKGIPMEHIAAQVGHSSVKTTETYVANATVSRKFA